VDYFDDGGKLPADVSAQEDGIEMKIVRWGILGTSGFARRRVFPALPQAKLAQFTAVASRELARAQVYAKELGREKAYGSYDELLKDPDIDAVYIALPNHKHAMWSVRAAEAGKHVLCEKPIALNASDVIKLIAAREAAHVKMGEAFMVACHPQWLTARALIQAGRIGEVKAVQGAFVFPLASAANIRNVAEYGGGALFDIGCYPVFCTRFSLGREPRRVCAAMEFDAQSKVDRLTSAMLDFGGVYLSFTCSIHLAHHQRMVFLGTKGRIQVELPFNPAVENPARVILDDGRDPFGTGASVIEIPLVNQYALQFDAFSRAILEDAEVPVTLENSLGNVKALDALWRSVESGGWEAVG
jgi:predicted dehydrogenase